MQLGLKTLMKQSNITSQYKIFRCFPMYSKDTQACTQIRNDFLCKNLPEAQRGRQDPRIKDSVKPTLSDIKENNL